MIGAQSGKQSGTSLPRTTNDTVAPNRAIGSSPLIGVAPPPFAAGQAVEAQTAGSKIAKGTQGTIMSIQHPRARVQWSDGTATWIEMKDLAAAGASSLSSSSSSSVPAPTPTPTLEAEAEDPVAAPAKKPPPAVNRASKPTRPVPIPSASTSASVSAVTPDHAPTLAPAPAPIVASSSSSSSSTPAASSAADVDGVIAPLYADGKKPTAADITAALDAHYGGNHAAAMNDPAFAGALMTAVGTHSGSNLHEKIKDAPADAKPLPLLKRSPVFNANWTLRHYTKSPGGTPGYNEIKSTAEQLAVDRKRNPPKDKSASNTNDADWAQIGNVGYTFYLLCIDGQVPPRTFLAGSTHFAEYEFTRLDNVFVSGDMLGSTSKAGGDAHASSAAPLRGSGEAVKLSLCKLAAGQTGDAASFLKALDQMFGVNFEVKVPGKLAVADGAWKQKA